MFPQIHGRDSGLARSQAFMAALPAEAAGPFRVFTIGMSGFERTAEAHVRARGVSILPRSGHPEPSGAGPGWLESRRQAPRLRRPGRLLPWPKDHAVVTPQSAPATR